MTKNDTVAKTAASCSIQDILKAREIIKHYARKTPLVESMFLSRNVTGGNVFLKLENMQLTGSFKFRGAFNRISRLTDTEKVKGVITVSAGNHAQGVALSSRLLGTNAIVVMPEGAPLVKQQATAGYGAEVVLRGTTFNDARLSMETLAKEKGLTIVHPYDDKEVIAGQGTIGLEILDEIWDVDTVILPVGGGGLISGVAIALKSYNPSIHIIGVQSENVHGMAASLNAGKITGHHHDFTLADGTDVAIPGNLTYPIVKNFVDEIILVNEEEIAEAMKDLMQRTKTLAEGAGALATAALISKKVESKWLKDKKIVSVVSGGNVDLTRVSSVIDHLLKPADTHKGVVG